MRTWTRMKMNGWWKICHIASLVREQHYVKPELYTLSYKKIVGHVRKEA